MRLVYQVRSVVELDPGVPLDAAHRLARLAGDGGYLVCGDLLVSLVLYVRGIFVSLTLGCAHLGLQPQSEHQHSRRINSAYL